MALYKVIHITKRELPNKQRTKATIKSKVKECTSSTEALNEIMRCRQLPEYRTGRLVIET